MSDQWYVQYPDRTLGPVSTEALRALASAGKLRPTDRVSSDMSNWLLASAVPELGFEGYATVASMPGRTSMTHAFGEPLETSETPLASGEVLGGYVIVTQIGAGAMGVVYRARQTALDRVVALKTIKLGRQNPMLAAARFTREAQAVARLRHPNIVTAYDYGHMGNLVFFTMELLEGETVEQWLGRSERADETFAWGVIRQAAAGLSHAAGHGIVHRDVKPANLFLTPPPTGYPLPPGLPMVKVTDFGLALLHEEEGRTRLTAANIVVGTPVYMSPETFSNAPADPRGDIYALGVTVYQLLTGRVPFDGATVMHVMQQKLNADLPSAPELTPKSLALIGAMTQPKPELRLGEYDELIARIDELLAGIGSGFWGTSVANRAARTRPPVAEPRFRNPLSRRGWFAVAGSLLAIAAGATWWLIPAHEPEKPTAKGVRRFSLFDGQTLSGWQPLGEWSPSRDEDGATVLAGRGEIRRSLPRDLGGDYALSLGVDLKNAEAIELQFAIQPESGGKQPRYVLRVSKAEGARLGERTTDDTPLQPRGEARSLPAISESRSPFHGLKIEKLAGRWWATFDGKPLGSLPERGPAKLREFRLVVDGGTAYFQDIECDELKVEP